MTIILAADHAGFALKKKMSIWLSKKGHIIIDVGADEQKKGDHYPVYAKMGTRAVKNTKASMGIFVCGSGVGMAITANRQKGIRATCAESVVTARRARDEDNANILVLGSRIVAQEKAKKIISAFLHTPFSGASRHKKRLAMIDES